MKKIRIITFGCSLNFSDTEVMEGLLVKHGYKITDKTEGASLVIVNSCTVKHSTETHFWKLLRLLKKKRKKVVIAGCISQTDSEKLKQYSLIGTTNISDIPKIVEETLKGNIIQLIKKTKNNRLNLPKIRKNQIVEIIPISQGCLGHCTYCKTKAARFNLRSYDKKAIICQAKDAVKDGVKELWLTAQDTTAYGKDIKTGKKTDITSLLKDLIMIKGDFKIRLGMGNPEHFRPILKKLIPLMKHKKMFRFLHIPVQSGNNKVLKAMKREYTVEQYKDLIKRLRKGIPNLTLSTDIIAGFPGETEYQFNDSLKLLKEIKPNILNISRYSARSKTLAANMEQVYGWVIKGRTRKITETFIAQTEEKNKKWLGWEGEILIDEYGKQGTDSMIGRTPSYNPVVVKDKIGKNSGKNKLKLGDKVKVRITSVTWFDLRAKII